jgi:hypothetical protein
MSRKNCNDNMDVFLSSGFLAKTIAKASSQPAEVPASPTMKFGPNSGQMLALLKRVKGASSYNLRFALLTGTTPGPWTVLPVTGVRKPVTVSNLTPRATYAFGVQALGSDGYSDWSDSSTSMVV